MVGRLLIGVGQLEQRRLAIGSAEERDADGQIVRGKARGYCQRRRISEERV